MLGSKEFRVPEPLTSTIHHFTDANFSHYLTLNTGHDMVGSKWLASRDTGLA